jgi:hypothetical protein
MNQRHAEISTPQNIASEIPLLEAGARLTQIVDRFINAVRDPVFPKVQSLQQFGIKGISVLSSDEGRDIECLGAGYQFVRRFLRFEKSNCLGVELGVVGVGQKPDIENARVRIYIRADEQVMIVSMDRDFSRSVATAEGMDAAAAAFLSVLGNDAVARLPKAPI